MSEERILLSEEEEVVYGEATEKGELMALARVFLCCICGLTILLIRCSICVVLQAIGLQAYCDRVVNWLPASPVTGWDFDEERSIVHLYLN